ncbi:PREDICTED: uncharacterized protein LOC101293587 [Fragaria vesca subsp. vesca]|uniref:uncharacterized protein LOC101293587 n=1 Tax=Fragaria vesca subsp. vesca TaxID=101020 RepID=UPI0002C3196A|nr:PREDICTED: uncharacterized protein LOC101293587 [Fragaria vesca subsp. vesca]
MTDSSTTSHVAASEAVGEDEAVGDSKGSPLWKYVTITREAKKGQGGNCEFQCSFCKIKFNGSHYRVKHHLLQIIGKGVRKCEKIPPPKKRELMALMESYELSKKMAGPRLVPLPSSSKDPSSSGSTFGFGQDLLDDIVVDTSKKRKEVGGSLEKSFNNGAREQLDGEIARMFYTGGLSFNLAKNPHYIRAFNRACAYPIAGYRPPNYNALRTTLLEKERNHIERLLEPIKLTWKQKGVSVCSDGWSDTQRRPLINVMAACESGPMFLRAENCEGESKDKHFISDLLIESILEIGPTHVVQVITDNASNCKAAGAIINARFPHIFWTPCVVHTLNLALKNICAPSSIPTKRAAYDECHWISEIADDVYFVKNFIMNHGMRLAMFNQHSELKMLSVAETRFASAVVMLKRFKKIKQSLQRMMISDEWDTYKDDDVGKARAVSDYILSNEWWRKIDYIISFTLPIYTMLRRCDTDKPCLHKVYEWWDTMFEEVKVAIYINECKEYEEESPFYNVVYSILLSRWTKSSTPLHCMAHSLNPRYYSTEYLSGAPNRTPPHQDSEIAKERKECLKKYYANEDQMRLVNEEFASFSACLDEFANSDSMSDRGKMDPMKWWIVHGSTTPNLQKIALKLLGQPCSSSCCERNWSTYTFIHSLRRNRITPQRAEDLVFVHNNLRLLSTRTPQYKSGDMWDIGGDVYDTMFNVNGGMLEIANLSLDEPDLEGVIFDNEDEDD